MSDAEISKAEMVLVGGARPGALARLDATVVERVRSAAVRVAYDPGSLLPKTSGFAENVDMVLTAARADFARGADQAAIQDFLLLFAERRNLPVPPSRALALDAAIMARWPEDLFVKAAHSVWEQFQELRVPNPPDFLAYIADDLQERRSEIAAIHTLQKRLETVARNGGEQIPADSF